MSKVDYECTSKNLLSNADLTGKNRTLYNIKMCYHIKYGQGNYNLWSY